MTFRNDEDLKNFQLFVIQDEIAETMECLNFSLDAVDEHVNINQRSSAITICIEDDDSELYMYMYMYMYSTDQMQGIRQIRLPSRVTNVFAFSCKRVCLLV